LPPDGFGSPTRTVGFAQADASGAWALRVNGMTSLLIPEGDYQFVASTIDAQGQRIASTPVDVRVDRTVSAGTIDLPAAFDSGFSQDDDVTANRLPRFEGTTEPFAAVTLRWLNASIASGGEIGFANADEFGRFSITASAAIGVNFSVTPSSGQVLNISGTAVDRAGNTGFFAPFTINLDNATTAPTLGLAVGQDTGVSASDGVTRVATPVRRAHRGTAPLLGTSARLERLYRCAGR
ncbi:MAG: Ig-like domain-containing protein, partial [Labrys sp. (in: a-proteobacteria)]